MAVHMTALAAVVRDSVPGIKFDATRNDHNKASGWFNSGILIHKSKTPHDMLSAGFCVRMQKA